MSVFVFIDFALLVAMAYYLISNLQWYNYSITRVLSKHHRQEWHLLYFVLPFIVYGLCTSFGWKNYFYVIFAGLYLMGLGYWIFKLDRPLKWTGRVWRFFVIFVILLSLDSVIRVNYSEFFFSFVLVFILSILCSNLIEFLLFDYYKKRAKAKIASMTQLKIILITASYGKTSIKNYLYQILKARFITYATPRSVNTLKGVILDINTNLDPKSHFYIVEAGARQKGDIAEIAQFLNPQYVIIGKIGPQHLEYFKTLDNIVQTKFEALKSERLKYALIESSNSIPQEFAHKILKKASEVRNIQATLIGTRFEVMLDGEWHVFETQVLGSFNAYNIALCIEMAKMLGMSVQEITNRIKRLEGVAHRLSKSEVGGKVILDDSFNGNLEGMKEAIRISSEHKGRKVIVTPGIVESTEEMNIELAKAIDEVFDIAIITGELNAQIFSQGIQKAKKILLKDKAQMENTLKATLKEGDLILFANDAPNYI